MIGHNMAVGVLPHQTTNLAINKAFSKIANIQQN